MGAFEGFYETGVSFVVTSARVEARAQISAVHTILLEEQSCSVWRDTNWLTYTRMHDISYEKPEEESVSAKEWVIIEIKIHLNIRQKLIQYEK